MKDTLSLYVNMKSTEVKDNISLENYCAFVKHGTYKDQVLAGRALKKLIEDPKDEHAIKYKELKSKQPCVTGSCVMNDGQKIESNIKSMNGYIVIDIDTDLSMENISALRADRYTRVLHSSFGGDGACIFVPINMQKNFRDSFKGLAQYYYDNYNIIIDHACSNPNRLRYMSYDPELFENTRASTFTHKALPKEPKPKELNFVFTTSDFDLLMEQIREKGIDLCKEEYDRYVRIGMALASKFGLDGEQYFHHICSYGSKYNPDHAKRDYAGFCKRTQGKSTIATIYYLCKEAGLSIYSERTKQIINRVKIAKSQGSPTFDSIAKNMLSAHEVMLNDGDKELVNELITSTVDFSKEAQEGLSDIKKVLNFIVDAYNPTYDEIKKEYYVNGVKREDRTANDIYIDCLDNFDFSIKASDVTAILNSSASVQFNKVEDFFKNNTHNEIGYIEQYARAIKPESEYNVWAFKRWLVGTVHNWTTHKGDKIVSPLTLVLTGRGQGIGKTSFFRNILPEELDGYFAEDKLDAKSNDSMFNLVSNLIVYDDEFGGSAMKDVKMWKSLSDTNTLTKRRPYGKNPETMKRIAGLCGSTNEDDIIKDVTGNRRILPIHVESIDYNLITTMDKAKLLVEAYNELKEGFYWIIRTAEDIAYLNSETENHQQVIPAEELFFSHFAIEPSRKFDRPVVMNQGDLIEYFSINTSSKMTKYDLKDIFVKNKIEYKLHVLKNTNDRKKGVKLYTTSQSADVFYKDRADD